MTITDHLNRQIRLARWLSYPIVVAAVIAWIIESHFKAVCGPACTWTHGGMVFTVCVVLLVVVHAVLLMRFKCPCCRASLKPDFGWNRTRIYTFCPNCAADFSQPMPPRD